MGPAPPAVIHGQESVLDCVFPLDGATMGVPTDVDVRLVRGSVNVDIGGVVAGTGFGPMPGPGLGAGLSSPYDSWSPC